MNGHYTTFKKGCAKALYNLQERLRQSTIQPLRKVAPKHYTTFKKGCAKALLEKVQQNSLQPLRKVAPKHYTTFIKTFIRGLAQPFPKVGEVVFLEVYYKK